MYQSGYLESDIWGEGFVDPHIWYAEVGPPDLVSGSYDSATLKITGVGSHFLAYRGSGELYYRKDAGAWVALSYYTAWGPNQIVGGIPTALAYGIYDLKVVTDLAEEDTLLNAFSVLPSTFSEYWIDYNVVAAGAGTAASPWNLAQLKAYFSYSAGYFPTDGDILYAKGDIPIDTVSTYIFNVDVGDSKTITLKAWDKATNGMTTIVTPTSGQDIFRIAATNSDVHLIVQDLVILPTGTAGPSMDPLVVVKSLDNSVAVNSFVFTDSMIISEEDISMTGATEKTNISIYGSNLSFGGTATFEIDEYSNTTLIYDSVINLEDTATINATGTPIWTHCESNSPTGSIPGTKTDCTFDNAVIERLPTALTVAQFYENDFNYFIFEISNVGGGIGFWNTNDMSYDIKGYARAGIGAFRFEVNTLYVDGSKVVPGDGTEADQLSFSQLRNFFNNSIGDAVGVSPTGYDTFLLTNIFVPVDDFFININEPVGGYSIIMAADIRTDKAWFIETKYIAGASFTILKFASSARMMKLIIRDFILTQNTLTMTDVAMLERI